jgi:hypothetical protein
MFNNNKATNQPQAVYVSIGRKLPHVYTTVERAYDGIVRLFPKGAKVLAGEQVLGDLTLEVLEDNIALHGILKISTMTHFCRLVKTYIDDIIPEEERI